MKLLELFAESWRAMRAARVPTTVIVLLCAAMSAASILTVGRTAAADQQLENRLESAGSRLLEIKATKPDVIVVEDLHATASLSITDQALGILEVKDVVNAAIGDGEPTAASIYSGEIKDIAVITDGRAPLPGEAIITSEGLARLNFDTYFGALQTSDGTTYPLVGVYEPREPFDTIGYALINGSADQNTSLSSLTLVATSAASATSLQDIAIATIAPADNSDIEVRSPQTLAALQTELRNDFGNYSTSLFLMILFGGGLLLAIVVFADTLLHRKDFGRRRALGISRSELVALVTLRTSLAAFAGTAFGCGASWLITKQVNATPPLDFTIAIGVLVFLCCTAAAALPALVVAYRDPVSVLRTP